VDRDLQWLPHHWRACQSAECAFQLIPRSVFLDVAGCFLVTPGALPGRRDPRQLYGASDSESPVTRRRQQPELKLVSARPGVISNHHLFTSQQFRKARSFLCGEHKTTEQTKVLSESDIYFSSSAAPRGWPGGNCADSGLGTALAPAVATLGPVPHLLALGLAGVCLIVASFTSRGLRITSLALLD
jgi:hypothetical protein